MIGLSFRNTDDCYYPGRERFVPELRAMVAPFGQGFRWEYGTFRYLPFGTGTYFYGVPR